MARRWSLLLACNLFLIAGMSAQDAHKEQKVLKNADILLLVKSHFDDETLVKLIEVSGSDFDISGEALITLENQGVSATVVRAMVEATQRNRRAAKAPRATPVDAPPATSDSSAPGTANANTPALATRERGKALDPTTAMQSMDPKQLAGLPAQMSAMSMGGMFSTSAYSTDQMPHVFLVAPTRQEIAPSTAEVAQTKLKSGNAGAGGTILRSLATQGLSFASMAGGPPGMMAMSAFSMASGFMPGMHPGGPSFTYVWGIPGRKSSRELADRTPRFELSYGEIPGVDPDRYEPALVKLFPTKDNYRLVGATRTKMDNKNVMSSMSPDNGTWISEERWPMHLAKEERGFYVMRVEQPLEPGEYAIVLRPVKGYKAEPSGFGGAAQVFYSVWDFSVPGAPVEGSGEKKKK